MRRLGVSILIAILLAFFVGCARFPSQPAASVDKQVRQWKVKSKNLPDYFEYLDKEGKIVSIGYDENKDGRADVRIDLLSVCSDPKCPKYVILLDGIPYKLAERYYNSGGFRLFYRPAKLISVFPSFTDLAYSELFGVTPIRGFEALYYDIKKKKLSDGDAVYLSQKNAPWQKLIDYRASMLLDPIGYVNPNFVFNHEIEQIESLFKKKREGLVIAYSVGTANVGTRYGEKGLMRCLMRVDNLCEKLIYEKRGRAQITILADHGHNLTPARYFDISSELKKAGFRVVRTLKKKKDVVCIEFGLVTCGELYTNCPDDVASAMLKCKQVNLAVYPKGGSDYSAIIVRNANGKAVIRKGKGGYVYKMIKGDPLELKGIIAKLKKAGKVSKEGVIDDEAFFKASVDHKYPDALARIWRCYHGLVENPANLLLTIKDGWFTGKRSFAKMINVASTHGSLNWKNSVTFFMTMKKLNPRPNALRIKDVRNYIKLR